MGLFDFYEEANDKKSRIKNQDPNLKIQISTN